MLFKQGLGLEVFHLGAQATSLGEAVRSFAIAVQVSLGVAVPTAK